MSPRFLSTSTYSLFWCGLSLITSAHLSGATGLQAFRMPYDDATDTITSLQSWQPTEAGSAGFLTVDSEGHYLAGSERLRLLGVNITATYAFPSHTLADAHAARLAKFGYNAVRFHHLEAPWAKDAVLVDYSKGDSRSLSADRLDKLHYFVSALAKKGIYSDINLLVSREFQPADGLGSDISLLGWKDQHVLGYFNDTALALQKEYAQKLLTAPNPYRGGKTLAEDPAVGFVEILNENGYLQNWYLGVLDSLPSSFAASLQAKWNTWLKARYADDAALNTAWGAVDQPLGSNTLSNGDFASGTSGWNLEQLNGAQGNFSTLATDHNGGPAAVINVTKAGGAGWYIQLTHGGLSLTKGKVYTLSFDARASASVPLSATLTRTGPSDYSGVMDSLSATLTTTWTSYSVTFEATSDEPALRLVFNNFGDRVCTVRLADVKLREGGKIGGLADGVSLALSNVPVVKRSGGSPAPTAAQKADWIAYILDAEKAYWDGMHDYLKNTVGVKGIVFGSILSTTTPNTQRNLDAMDSHAYWRHPTWPAGKDWDPVLWTVDNVSMVNYPGNSTVGMIARQRVQGKPHNVTEYQHPSPNSYASEGFLLASAIGAVQDWDSVWAFEYVTGTTEYVTGFFDTGGHAGKMANNVIASSLFRRGDLKPARRLYRLAMSPDTEASLALTSASGWNMPDGGHLGESQLLSITNRLALTIGDGATGLDTVPAAPTGSVYTSDTGELVWDTSVSSKGVVTVNTAKTKAVIGFVAGRTFTLGDVTVKPGTTRLDWCTVGLTLLSGNTFSDVSPFGGLIVATGDQENTGQVWKDSTKTSLGSNWGTAPVVVETIPATVTLPVSASRVQVWALDGTGARVSQLTVSDVGGKATFDLGSGPATLWYEFQVSGGSAAAPAVTGEPLGVVGTRGKPATLSASFSGNPLPSYQWYQNDVAITGATASTLTLPSLGDSDAGTYKVVATNASGSATTRTVTVALADTVTPANSRLYNLSTRAPVGTGASQMVAGFVVAGTRQVLVRGIGPKLGFFGVQGLLADPALDFYHSGSSTPFAQNDDWVPSEIGSIAASLGAFPIDDSPKESAAVLTLGNGGHTAVLSGTNGGTGVGLLEVYDTGVGSGTLVNLSTRALVGTGNDSLFVGFAILGTAPKHVVIRGVGPTLGLFGVSGTVADPSLTLYDVSTGAAKKLYSNDDWQDSQRAIISGDFAASGAFGLPDTSRDAAIDLWLEPGVYSAQMESKDAAGIGLVEVYEVP